MGNFAGSDGGTPDIAFFHYRLEMHLVPRRVDLVEATCKVLTELCLTVFNYDALITLFYESGAPSRFIKQKIMLNLAPMKSTPSVASAAPPPPSRAVGSRRKRCLVLLHLHLPVRPAHTQTRALLRCRARSRHNFFMTEYRAIEMEDPLLERQGLDPTTVAREEHAEGHLYNVVN